MIPIQSTVFDFRDIEIKVGDTLAYPGRKGSELYMTEGTVTDIYETGEIEVQSRYTGKRRCILRTDRVVVLGR